MRSRGRRPQRIRHLRWLRWFGAANFCKRLKSLGPAFATTLTQEVFYKDFRNRREVASYFGLAPSPWQSGGTDRDQGISKAGNPRARCAALGLSWLWLRHQPGSELSRWFRQRTLNAGKRTRRIAIVALALPHNRTCARRGGAQVGRGAMI
jgi:transposase